MTERGSSAAPAGGSPPGPESWAERVRRGDAGALLERMPGPLSGEGRAGRVEAALPPGALAPGELLARRYRILRRLGSGGAGVVVAARDEVLGREVAVKVLARPWSDDARAEQAFRRESQILAALSHPGIVAIHELGREDELLYIVMELAPGRPLDQVIGRLREESAGGGRARRGPPRGEALERAIGEPPPEAGSSLIDPHSRHRSAARISLELARTIEAAHARGVIHRDLKPHNVVLRGGGRPMVLDFGIAGSLEHAAGEVTQGLFGTPGYLAPEQLKENRTGSDPRTDVYQLGLILYELLTLQRAFPKSGPGGAVERTLRGDFERPRQVDPSVPPELEAICLQAMELRRERRYPSARALREDLERYLEGRSPRAGGVTHLGRALRNGRYAARRHPIASAAAGSIAAASVAALGAVLWLGAAAQVEVPGAFRLPEGAVRPIPIAAGDAVFDGDWLGAQVRSEFPVVVYALSITGGPDPGDQYLRPIRPRTLRGLRGDDPDEAVGHWGIRTASGVEHVGCVAVRAGEGEQAEGLLVFASAEPLAEVEEWLARLERRRLDYEVLPGVPRSTAEGMLSAPLTPRGDPLSELPREQARRHLERLSPEVVLGRERWPDGRGTRFEALFPVRRRPEGDE